MDNGTPIDAVVRPDERLLMVVGNFGSGKTEVAVNLALRLAEAGRRVQLADLDLVNPYFRSREARRVLEDEGIRVVVPPGDQAYADLPIVLPEIAGMVEPSESTTTIFDVGGDDVGARALASLRPRIADDHYQLWQVVNANRPFTSTVDGCLAIQGEIETASRLSVTGIIANAHLVDDTTPETVVDGWRLARRVADACSRPLRAVAVMAELAGEAALEVIDVPLLLMQRHMLPPWLAPTGPTEEDGPGEEDGEDGSTGPLPAARTIPLGKPEAHSLPSLPGRPRNPKVPRRP